MRLFTPEISWHETLPIYSCDFQNRLGIQFNAKNQFVVRHPLAELKPDSQLDLELDAGWTRLATAGGDSVVRLWRVQLQWMLSSTDNVKSDGSIELPSNNIESNVNKKQNSAIKSNNQLTYLASLKRHEKPVNVVRWSPSGRLFLNFV